MKFKLREWTLRYAPAEFMATVIVVLCGVVTHHIFHNQAITALASTWGENAGYYSYIFIQDIRARKKKDTNLTVKGMYKIFRNMVVEFGPAEYLDSFLIRPTAMYMFQSVFGSLVIGLVVGKYIADFIFYCITIVFYELRKKHLND